MPRWLKVLLSTVLLLGLMGSIGYHVLAWRAQDSLVVRQASIEREPDGSIFINFEFHNRSRFPIRVVDISTLFAADDHSFDFVPPERMEPFLLKAGAQYHHRVLFQHPRWPMPSTEGIISANWTPESATWLAPLFSKLDGVYQKVRPASGNLMPEETKTVNRTFVIRKTTQGDPELVELQDVPPKWLFAWQRWQRER